MRDSSVCIISCMRQPVAQQLDKIHVLVSCVQVLETYFGSRYLRANSLLGFD